MDSVARKLRIHASAKNSRNKNRNRNRNRNQSTRKTPRAPPPSPATSKPPRIKTPRTVQAEQIAKRLPNKKTMVLQASSNNNNTNSVNMSQEEFWDLLEKEIGTSI